MSGAVNTRPDVDMQRLPVNYEEYSFNNWTISYKKSHILHSQCTTTEKCAAATTCEDCCLFCKYTKTLELPHLPEMVFPNNILTLKHTNGAQMEFNALDALKRVTNGKLPLKVACADVWKESRDPGHLEEKIKPFDWTFSTDYKGTLSNEFTVVETDERINIDRLKEKEAILFYQELMLYEDELHDNGIASCTVKIRVMPSSYFVLLRYFLRVDNVMVRVNDTRVFHDFNTNYLLREYTNKEHGFQELGLPLTMFSDPNLISPHLPLRTGIYEKITLSSQSTEANAENTEAT